MRAGAHALSLLAVPLNVHVLQALEEEPRALVDLRRAVGSPPQTTMRGHLRALTEAGILNRRRQSEFPGTVDYELAEPGRELLAVAEVLQTWLLESPEGALQLGSVAAKSAIKALVEGWSSAVIRALAAKPLALTELSRLITGLSYPSLERRLGAMRLAGQIEPCPGASRGTPYKVTNWLRRSIGPLSVAALWERRHMREAATPIRRIDIEAGFLLVLPLVSLPDSHSGECRFAVEMRNGSGETRLIGVIARVRGGSVVSCVARLDGKPGAWISGSAAGWLRAMINPDQGTLETGGDRDLALGLLEGVHGALFGARQRA